MHRKKYGVTETPFYGVKQLCKFDTNVGVIVHEIGVIVHMIGVQLTLPMVKLFF